MISNAENTITELSTQLEQLGRTNTSNMSPEEQAAHKKAIEEIKSKITEAENQKAEGEKKKTESEKTKSEGEQLKSEGEQLKNEAQDLAKEAEGLKNEAQKLSEESNSLSEEASTLRSDAESLNKESKNLKTEADNAGKEATEAGNNAKTAESNANVHSQKADRAEEKSEKAAAESVKQSEKAEDMKETAQAEATKEVEAPEANAPLDGVVENTKQGKTGDCWLLRDINSMKQTEWGKQAIADAIKPDGEGGAKIHFPGAEEGKQDYHITKEEIDEANKTGKYSKGDDDMVALELAAERYYKSIGKEGIDGASDAYLFGKEDRERNFIKLIAPESTTHTFIAEQNYKLDGEDKYKMVLDEIEKHPGDYAVGCNFGKVDEDDLKKGITRSHAYTVKGVTTNDNSEKIVSLINPWDSSKIIEMPEKEFLKKSGGLTVTEGPGSVNENLCTTSEIFNKMYELGVPKKNDSMYDMRECQAACNTIENNKDEINRLAKLAGYGDNYAESCKQELFDKTQDNLKGRLYDNIRDYQKAIDKSEKKEYRNNIESLLKELGYQYKFNDLINKDIYMMRNGYVYYDNNGNEIKLF